MKNYEPVQKLKKALNMTVERLNYLINNGDEWIIFGKNLPEIIPHKLLAFNLEKMGLSVKFEENRVDIIFNDIFFIEVKIKRQSCKNLSTIGKTNNLIKGKIYKDKEKDNLIKNQHNDCVGQIIAYWLRSFREELYDSKLYIIEFELNDKQIAGNIYEIVVEDKDKLIDFKKDNSNNSTEKEYKEYCAKIDVIYS